MCVLGRDLQKYFPSFYPRKKEKRTYFYRKKKTNDENK